MDKSKDKLLSENLTRRMRRSYTSILEEVESQFPNILTTKQWEIARYNILNISNDAIRATKQELEEFAGESNTFNVKKIESGVSVKQSFDFLQLLNNIIFSSLGFSIFANCIAQEKCLNVLFKELNCGAIDYEDGRLVYCVFGLETCINVLSILDNMAWPIEIKEKYINWRKKLIVQYRR